MQSKVTKNLSARFARAILLIIFPLVLASQVAQAQDTGNNDESEKVKQLEELKKEAELRKAIAEARKAELEARFPKSDIETLKGETKLVGEKRVEEQLAGHISVADAANRIAAAIKNKYKDKINIVIYNQGDIQLLLIYSAATKRVDAYTGRYTSIAAAELAALNANPMWTVPTAPCDDRALASPGAGVGGAGFVNPLGIATSFLGSFAEILSFFRTDVSITGSTFDVGEPVIVTEVFRALRSKYGDNNVSLYYPSEIPPGFDPRRDSPMLTSIEALFNAKAEADARAAQIAGRVADKTEQRKTLVLCQRFAGEAQAKLQTLINTQQKAVDDVNTEIAKEPGGRATKPQATKLAAEHKKLDDFKSRFDPQIATLEANKRAHNNDIARLDREIAALQAAAQPLPALNAQADLLVKDLIKVDEKTGLNPLTAFIRAEMIQYFMKEYNAYWLKLRVVIAGGNTKVKTNLFVDVFNGGNRVFYSGASIVEYHLYNQSGESLLSDTTNSYVDYQKAKDLKKLTDSRSVVDQQ
jgi:hypothetical protein